MRDKMLITLCYVYLWVRFHKCYSVLIRNSLSRLNSSSFSFSFSLCSGSRSSSASTRSTVLTGELHAAARRRTSSPQLEDNIFLQLGDKAVYVTEPQVCDDLSKWTALLGSSLVCGPRIENISFIIEATGHKVGYPSLQPSNKKLSSCKNLLSVSCWISSVHRAQRHCHHSFPAALILKRLLLSHQLITCHLTASVCSAVKAASSSSQR